MVSSVQISSNDLFKVGDWIEAPQFGADGDVIDIDEEKCMNVEINGWWIDAGTPERIEELEINLS